MKIWRRSFTAPDYGRRTALRNADGRTAEAQFKANERSLKRLFSLSETGSAFPCQSAQARGRRSRRSPICSPPREAPSPEAKSGRATNRPDAGTPPISPAAGRPGAGGAAPLFPHLAVDENLLSGGFVRRPNRRELKADVEHDDPAADAWPPIPSRCPCRSGRPS